MDKIKLVYLTGIWKSGATVVGRVMESSDEAIFVGEIRDFWFKGMIKNEDCSCGNTFEKCNFWQNVKNEYVKAFPDFDVNEVNKDIRELEKWKNYFKLKKLLKNNESNPLKKSLENYLKHHEILFEIIAKQSGKNVIIDSSRLPRRLLALSFSDKFEIYPVYLVRDPRGIINSYIKLDIRRYGENRHSTIKHMITWNIKNILSLEVMKKVKFIDRLYICYEKFTRDPVKVSERIKQMLNLNFSFEKKGNDNIIYFKKGHVFAGNRNRFEFGEINIKEDSKWKKELGWFKKTLITLGSFPIYKFIVNKYDNS